MKHYKLTKTTKVVEGVLLTQIQYIKDGKNYKSGELGGWIDDKSTLDSTSWIDVSTNLIDSTVVEYSSVTVSTVRKSAITRSALYRCELITNSEILDSKVVVSSVKHSAVTSSAEVTDSYIDHSKAHASTIMDSKIYDSCCYSSTTNGVTIQTSVVTKSALTCGTYQSARLNQCSIATGSNSVFGYPTPEHEGVKVTTANFAHVALHTLGTNVNILSGMDVMTIGPAPSSGRRTTAYINQPKGNLVICTGCFEGTIKQFVEQIRLTHANNKLACDAYLAYASLIRKWYKQRSANHG